MTTLWTRTDSPLQDQLGVPRKPPQAFSELLFSATPKWRDTLADFVHHLGYVGIVVFTALAVYFVDLKNFPKPPNYLETELSSLNRILHNRCFSNSAGVNDEQQQHYGMTFQEENLLKRLKATSMCLPAALRPLFEAGKGDKISPGYQEPANWTRAAPTKR
ncbi:Mitochondrial import inner membrane translocase subunit [Trichinella spiralis]|uniref:Mitochondrial import inner membrane translocase subunit n=1 Tax=Trichinella spiralis TaxID=6334 RepID=A0ABR3K6Z1_TRISP